MNRARRISSPHFQAVETTDSCSNSLPGPGGAGDAEVTEPSDGSVRFKCPRCFLPLEVPSARAGAPYRCPRCQWVFTAPLSTPKEIPREEYSLREGSEPSPEDEPSYVAVTCPVCDTRMQALADHAGREIRCPDCGTRVVVPSPAETATKKPKTAPVGEYALNRDVDEWRSRLQAKAVYITVTCPVCGTMMQAGEDQVGSEIVCPDCHVPAVVPPATRTKLPLAGPVAPTDDEYAVWEGSGQPSAGSAADRSYVAVECPLCNTRLHATEDQVGREIVCPDCGRSVVVPPPKPSRPKLDVMAGADEGYAVAAAVEVPRRDPLLFRPRWHAGYDVPAAKDRAETSLVHLLPDPPRRPLLSGILSFPFYRGVRVRWFGLTTGLLVVLLLGRGAYCGGMGAAAGFGGFGSGILGLVLMGTTVLVGMIWTVVASGCLLAVIIDTAAGADRIENWPEAVFLDWALDAFFVVNSLALSAAVALGIGWALQAAGLSGPPAFAAFAAGVFVLLPIVLLSMLETNSSLKPLSVPVWRSLWCNAGAWLVFYAETALLTASAGLLVWLSFKISIVLGIPATAVLLVTPSLIYTRLLGRLAWCCTRRAISDRAGCQKV